MVDRVADEGRGLQLLGAVLEILPHQVLGEAEGREHDLLEHLEARGVADLVPDDRPDAGDVDPVLVRRQLLRELAEVDLEVLPQHLHEREVEDRLVLVEPQLRPRRGRSRVRASPAA